MLPAPPPQFTPGLSLHPPPAPPPAPMGWEVGAVD